MGGNYIKTLITSLLLWLAPCSSMANQVILPVDEAFQFSAQFLNSNQLRLDWHITEGFQLYRDTIVIAVPAQQDIILPTSLDNFFPAAIEKHDPYAGTYHAYIDNFHLAIPVSVVSDNEINFLVEYQGCANSGFCYPPERKLITFFVDSNSASINAVVSDGWGYDMPNQQLRSSREFNPTPSEFIDSELSNDTFNVGIGSEEFILQTSNPAINLLVEKQWLLIIPGFLLLGLLLSFTPCVLPMIPILSTIIIGQRKGITTAKAFRLSVVYVLAMASTYAIAGVISAALGFSLQAMLQKPWIIISFSLIFIALALSLFGFFELRLPGFMTNHINNINHQRRGGTYINVAIMGILATLITSPCITPPLVGVLGYIASTNDMLLGGVALFVMGLGMGVPLIIIGTTEGKYLPKTGPWMHTIKNIFGVGALAVAIWLLSNILPGQIELILWAVLLIISAMYLNIFNFHPEDNWAKFWQGSGWLMFIYGVVLMIGGIIGNDNPLKPLENIRAGSTAIVTEAKMNWAFIDNTQHLQQALATKNNKPSLAYAYADWCIDCRHMEKETFSSTEIAPLLMEYFNIYKIDLTNFNAEKRELIRELGLFGPPALVFFSPNGELLPQYTLTGFINTEDLSKHINSLITS